MPHWSLKYSLTFLLGAMSLGLFLILQLQRDKIRVEIHWKRTPVSHSSYADHPEAIGIKFPSPSDAAANINVSDVLSINSLEFNKDTAHRDSEDSKDLQKTETGLLSRHVRQVSPVLEGHLSLSNITIYDTTRAPKRKKTKRSKSDQLSATKNAPRYVVPLEEALSKTAPDWVGSTIPPVDVTDFKCADKICMEYLSEVDQDQFTMCVQRTVAKKDRIGQILPNFNATCRFQNGTYRHPVALASFPGSGNTWLRGLLQKTTGICTGSMYCDNVLRARGFTGEFIRGSSSIAVKVHGIKGLFTNGKLPQRIFNRTPIFGAAILLVRDPKSALVAEWHRERTKRQTNATSSNHYLSAGEEFFKNNEDWDHFVQEQGKRWSDHVSGWIITGKDNPFHIVRYEDLKNDTVKELKKILDFLGFPHITEADIDERLGEGYNSFYRNHKDDFRHYTEKQKSFVHLQVQETINTLREHGMENVFPIHKYL